MNLFGRKNTNTSNSGSEPSQQESHEVIAHRFTMELGRAESLAVMLAISRAAAVVEVADLLAGMYIYSWDRLSRYWDEEDKGQIESMLQQICQISPQRWHHWMEFYDKKRRDGEEQRSWLPPWKLKKEPPAAKEPAYSTALTALLKQAEEIAPFRDQVNGKDIPILTSECVLLCIVRTRGSEVSRKLAASGLNVPQLEKDALFSRRARRDS
jgi:hypothetical protein